MCFGLRNDSEPERNGGRCQFLNWSPNCCPGTSALKAGECGGAPPRDTQKIKVTFQQKLEKSMTAQVLMKIPVLLEISIMEPLGGLSLTESTLLSHDWLLFYILAGWKKHVTLSVCCYLHPFQSAQWVCTEEFLLLASHRWHFARDFKIPEIECLHACISVWRECMMDILSLGLSGIGCRNKIRTTVNTVLYLSNDVC